MDCMQADVASPCPSKVDSQPDYSPGPRSAVYPALASARTMASPLREFSMVSTSAGVWVWWTGGEWVV